MIGERLAGLRKERGWKQDKLADELQISVHTVMSYEQNKSDPDDEMKTRICQMFDVSADYLLGLIDEEIPLKKIEKVDIPKGFLLEDIPKVKEYIRLLYVDQQNRK